MLLFIIIRIQTNMCETVNQHGEDIVKQIYNNMFPMCRITVFQPYLTKPHRSRERLGPCFVAHVCVYRDKMAEYYRSLL